MDRLDRDDIIIELSKFYEMISKGKNNTHDARFPDIDSSKVNYAMKPSEYLPLLQEALIKKTIAT